MKKDMTSSPPAWKGPVRREILAAKKILILAVGNTSKGDDAAGILCAQELKKLMGGKACSRLKILLGHETPENTTGEIRKFHPNLVLILDAAQGQYKPGAVFIVGKNQIEDDGVSTHTISLALLVAYLEETIGCKVMVLGIQPLDLRLGENISPIAKKSAKNLAAFLSQIIGVKPTHYA
jgi:hydrogenase 3 maturation protease